MEVLDGHSFFLTGFLQIFAVFESFDKINHNFTVCCIKLFRIAYDCPKIRCQRRKDFFIAQSFAGDKVFNGNAERTGYTDSGICRGQ